MQILANLTSQREYREIRTTGVRNKIFQDSLGKDDRELGWLDIDCTPAEKPHWPEAFSNYLTSYPLNSETHIQFSGTGYNSGFFNCSGVIHAISPQESIPGWQRITLMKKYIKPTSHLNGVNILLSTSNSLPPPDDASGKGFALHSEGDAEDRVVNDRCWAHEGVILPGGMIMLGRWWSPIDRTGLNLETGPWMAWRVADREEEK